ncbi:hypothetical protein K488DRAFT_82033 [Vararia minispora EC-137]|uniref:Uncharacterized protein n=1 Tax=Vararia minispora EC-137 TaxID=1314806 RepID=A0ACB8QWY4_9AGAM|nr:hypothetical protein K488DRAFT_82033 [Vararia minispora EC-137]
MTSVRFTGEGWNFLSDFASTAGTISAIHYVGTVAVKTYYYVTADGVVVPSNLTKVEQDLKTISDHFASLSSEEKQIIEQYRQSTHKKLSDLQVEHRLRMTEFRYQLIKYNDSGWLATWMPFHPKAVQQAKDAKALARKVSQLHKDTLATTSSWLRPEKSDKESLQMLRDAEEGRTWRGWEAEDALTGPSDARGLEAQHRRANTDIGPGPNAESYCSAEAYTSQPAHEVVQPCLIARTFDALKKSHAQLEAAPTSPEECGITPETTFVREANATSPQP